MKIGIVCYPTLGGSGIIATELGHLLAKKNHEVHFITYEPPFRLRVDRKKIHFHQVDINQYELFRYPDYALTLAVKIAEVAKKHKLDIIHVHYAIPHATSAYLAKQLLGKVAPKIVTTLHGTDITLVGRDPAYFEIVQFSIEQSDAVTSVSHSLKKEICNYFQIKKSVEVIHNFFIPSPGLIGKKPLKARYAPKGEKLIVHASNFRSVKRVEDVVRTFGKISEKLPAKLLLVGYGPEIETVRALVQNLNLESNTYFLGKTKEADIYVASADLFLLPSAQESFGLAALEAMSYGVPVIATDIGGIPEVVKHGKSGFLSPIGDAAGMAQNALKLLTDENLYQKFSRKAAERAGAEFHVNKILPQYEMLYNRLLT